MLTAMDRKDYGNLSEAASIQSDNYVIKIYSSK